MSFLGTALGQAERALVAALGVDGVLTAEQAMLVAGSADALNSCLHLELVSSRDAAIRPTAYSVRTIPTRLVFLTRQGVAAAEEVLGKSIRGSVGPDDEEIEHRLGVAEMRRRLGIPPHAWTSALELHVMGLSSAGAGFRGLPDGIARVNGEIVVVEYDHGGYSPAQISLKLRVFSGISPRAVWGVPTGRRAGFLRKLGCKDVMVVRIPVSPLPQYNGLTRD
jgi:hypothetical protein